MAIISNRMLFMGSLTWSKYVTGYYVNINHAHIKVFHASSDADDEIQLPKIWGIIFLKVPLVSHN